MESESDHTISEGEGENENKSTSDPLIVPLNEFRCLDCFDNRVPPPTPKPNVAQNIGGVDANAPPTPFYVDDDSSGRTLDLLWIMERTSGSVPNQKSTEPSGNAADGVDLDLKL
ncbi:hypothetical protein SESBI_32902 [Sesbania bispinosa]|nr:hypothetical protein SESBI_32902 [Sesbania bispinosa]